MSGPTGLDRVQAAIERARGLQPPDYPVTLCGTPGPDARRADDPRWSSNRISTPSLRDRFWSAVGDLLCPSCLSLRFGPGHLVRKYLMGVCEEKR